MLGVKSELRRCYYGLEAYEGFRQYANRRHFFRLTTHLDLYYLPSNLYVAFESKHNCMTDMKNCWISNLSPH